MPPRAPRRRRSTRACARDASCRGYEAFVAAQCREPGRMRSPTCDELQCAVRRTAAQDDSPGSPAKPSGGRCGVEQAARAQQAQRRQQRRGAGGPEHRRETQALAQRTAGHAADHARSAVAEHGVQRLAAAAQAARESGARSRRCRRVLGGEGDRMQELRQHQHAMTSPKAAIAREAQRRHRRRPAPASCAPTARSTQRPWEPEEARPRPPHPPPRAGRSPPSVMPSDTAGRARRRHTDWCAPAR